MIEFLGRARTNESPLQIGRSTKKEVTGEQGTRDIVYSKETMQDKKDYRK